LLSQNRHLSLKKPANRRLSGGDTVVEPPHVCFASFDGFVTL